MLDFVTVRAFSKRKDTVEIYPEFALKSSKDLMIRGHAFYAIWDEEHMIWSTSEFVAVKLIDQEILRFAEEYRKRTDQGVIVRTLKDFSSKKWLEFLTYCKNSPDNYHELDSKIIFQNTKVKKEDYSSFCLPYNLIKGPHEAYDELIGTLYDPSEKKKLEWAIGSIIAGDSKSIQKFIVLYGGPGTGKSTMLDIINNLFTGYTTVFDAKTLGQATANFALEMFRSNPLVAIQHDGDLSHIEDNTKLNSIVSHETMMVNEKFKSTYQMRFNTFLMLGTNMPVKITDAKSGILRRLIDVRPSGRKVTKDRYDILKNKISFELGAIADHCLKVYKSMGASYYDGYVPNSMMSETNDFYNFIEENYEFFSDENPDGVTLKTAWLRYKEYCTDANIPYPYKKTKFKNELKNYFAEFVERTEFSRNIYRGFIKEKFDYIQEEPDEPEDTGWIHFDKKESLFDQLYSGCPAQYANQKGTPVKKWADVTTELSDLDTTKLHYVKVPKNMIVIDFDIKDENGEKDLHANLEAANKCPPTYAELSKSGSGIHLHYIYEGDVEQLSRIFDKDIEVKVSVGDSALRRMLTLCNDISLATISSGLPLRGIKRVVNNDQIKSERKLRALIKKSLRKEIHGHTKPEIDFIHYILEQAYDSGMTYDVTDLRPAIQAFAVGSSNQPNYCLKTVGTMHFHSAEEVPENEDHSDEETPFVLFDIESYVNLFLVCWKRKGFGNKVVPMLNPSPEDIQNLVKMRLVGFNNRRYDNHMLYAAMMGYTIEQLYVLSQRIINDDKNALFGPAYNLSYTDIYDFLSSKNKMSLKKWEIQLGIRHMEMDIPWDQPVPEDRIKDVVTYCCNDVLAAEAVFDANQADWDARLILTLLSGLTPNDTTNSHTTKIIVGNDPNPQAKYIYTDLSTIFPGYRFSKFGIKKEEYNEGTKIVSGKSWYRGEDPGEGGRVYAKPGIYYRVGLLDVVSMHPHSAIWLKVFGEEITARFEHLVEARVSVKNGDLEQAKMHLKCIIVSEDRMQVLEEYLSNPDLADKLADALKTAINSVYGLTAAKFPNKLRDPRNVDNIVAKYGALFMINLQFEVEARGYTVVHIKTDSIKIAYMDNEIRDFCMDYAKEYGYTFDHEATYRKMCLVNDSVYIAQYEDPATCEGWYGYSPKKNKKYPLEWTATGAQFKVPYVFKTLFSKEPIEFEDLCETKQVTSALYLDMNENLPEGEHDYRFCGKVGSFCPILPGHGGGVLLRKDEDKYNAVNSTKKKRLKSKDEIDIYYWMEAEMVKNLQLEEAIDRGYYNELVEEAIDTVNKFGDFDIFISDDDQPAWMNVPIVEGEVLPFD